MSALEAAIILGLLGLPGVGAPTLARARPRFPGPIWRLLASILCLLPLMTPLVIAGSPHRRVAMVLAILGGIVMLKAIDWLSDPRHEEERVRVWLALTFWPALEIEDVGIRFHERARGIALGVRRLARGSAGVTVGLLLAAAGQSFDLPARGIWLDGSLKAMEIYALAGGGNDLMVAALALAGYRATDAFRYPIFARSVLDFWSRYNVWIHRWLKRHVFAPIGRRWRRPALGILAVFGLSGLLHEYLIVVSVPEMIGWQFAFFGLHGLGALVGAWLGRRYRSIAGRHPPRALAVAATLAFVLATVPIFTRCMDRIVDLHRDVGSWVLDSLGQDRHPSNAALPASRVASGRIDCDDGDLVVVDTIDNGIGKPTYKSKP